MKTLSKIMLLVWNMRLQQKQLGLQDPQAFSPPLQLVTSN